MKLLIIGLDGAGFRLINGWIKEGKLPHFKKLIEDGASGNLKSTIPPVTFPAVPSLITGKNPGKHGVFDFTDIKLGSYDAKVNSSSSIHSKKLWNYLDDAGLKSAFINLPCTFPVEKINGAMVGGMFTPSVNSKGFVFPEEIKDEIGEYKIEPSPLFSTSKEKFINESFEIFEKRKGLTKKLLSRDFDLFFVFFRITDHLQHFFWKDSDILLKTYQKLDSFIKEMLKTNKFSDVLIISDHGFRPLERCFNVNDWLIQEGFLKLKAKESPSYLNFLKRLNINDQTVFNFLKKFKIERHISKIPASLRRLIPKREALGIESLNIDWKNTKSFSQGELGKIYINTKNKREDGFPDEDYEKIRDEVINKLKKLKDEGKQLKLEVHKSGDVYSGEYLENAPDLLFNLDDYGYQVKTSVGHKNVFEDLDPEGRSGDHEMDGIVIAFGENIKPGRLEGANIVDIFPTVLNFFDIAIADDVDGVVLKDLFKVKREIKHQKKSEKIDIDSALDDLSI